MQERDQAVQKRAYKLLAYITARRRDFTLPNLREVLETLLAGRNHATIIMIYNPVRQSLYKTLYMPLHSGR